MKYSIQRVRVVTYLFIVIGFASWLQFLITYWTQGSMVPGVEMIVLPAGLGLLRHSDGWRKVSIGLIASEILVVVSIPILGYTISPVMNVRFYGVTLDPTSTTGILYVIIYAVLILTCLIWLTFALCDKDVRTLFTES
ncbi:MAG: hypothetical protein BMS9Abin05_1123 [Rhodothermia bacterium]|nr:MAG: hypothetical protein BMS9Abin05_1123 [Rhodothermia bacterium]